MFAGVAPLAHPCVVISISCADLGERGKAEHARWASLLRLAKISAFMFALHRASALLPAHLNKPQLASATMSAAAPDAQQCAVGAFGPAAASLQLAECRAQLSRQVGALCRALEASRLLQNAVPAYQLYCVM